VPEEVEADQSVNDLWPKALDLHLGQHGGEPQPAKTISRAEAEEGQTTLTIANLKAIQVALECAGIEFIPQNGGGAGVRFKNPA
jgi:hypothetical protein